MSGARPAAPEMTPERAAAVAGRASLLHSEREVERALDRMAAAISKELSGLNPVLLCVMTGGVVVCGRLATRLHFPLQLDYAHLTRYRGATRGGELAWERRPGIAPAGRTVLAVDDVLDDGLTLAALRDHLMREGAARMLTAVLVRKRRRRPPGIPSGDFVGLEAGDRYLFGCGMDYRGYLRNAPGIHAVDPADE